MALLAKLSKVGPAGITVVVAMPLSSCGSGMTTGLSQASCPRPLISPLQNVDCGNTNDVVLLARLHHLRLQSLFDFSFALTLMASRCLATAFISAHRSIY